ncbi:MAG: hypothetical protein M1371_02640 [Actinobacteria bacterium]|nr:hypothetical protein [Actinomycetota bacterium]
MSRINKGSQVSIIFIIFLIGVTVFGSCLNIKIGTDKTIENKSVNTETGSVNDASTSFEIVEETEQVAKLSESYPAIAIDESGMKWMKETDHYIYYYNETPEDFIDRYISIAESGYLGIEGIFGEPTSKIKIYIAETVEEFKTVSNGVVPPDFDGSQAVGQSIDGVVHVYKPAEFKPGNSYEIGLLHEIGHAVYFQLYPNAAKKNDWLNEGLADKSITGLEIDLYKLSSPELKEAIESGKFINLVDLEKISKRTANSEGEINFIEYISLVNFIALEFGFDKLQIMLSKYDQGDDLVTAIEAGTGLDSNEFESKWLTDIKSTN